MIYSSLLTHYTPYVVGYSLILFAFYAIYLGPTFLASWKKCCAFFLLYCAVAFAITDTLLVKQENTTRGRIFGYASAYAMVFEEMGHETITENTPANDKVYLELVQLQKDWLRANPYIADIYTMKQKADGGVYLAVDSETDYDHDGHIDQEREKRTPIGEAFDGNIKELQDALKGQQVFKSEIYTDRWGSWVSAFIPIKNSEGQPAGILGIDFSSDVYFGELNQILFMSFLFFAVLFVGCVVNIHKNFKLSLALKEADKARRVKTEFLANMSHEIRTPLNGIIGVAQLMDPTHMDETELEKLHILKTSAKTLLDLVNDVLDFSALEESKIRLEEVSFDIHELVEGVINMLSYSAKEKGIYLYFEKDNYVNSRIYGDPTRIRQVLINLVGNAIKFTAQGGVSVILREVGFNGGQKKYMVSVKDTGIGLSPEAKKRLFKSFSQADTSTTRKYGGSGLGLAICKALVDLMGGEIDVDSTPDKGSTFFFTFLSRTQISNSSDISIS